VRGGQNLGVEARHWIEILDCDSGTSLDTGSVQLDMDTL